MARPIVLIPHLFSVSRRNKFQKGLFTHPLVRHLDPSLGRSGSLSMARRTSCFHLHARRTPGRRLLGASVRRGPLAAASQLHPGGKFAGSIAQLSACVHRSLAPSHAPRHCSSDADTADWRVETAKGGGDVRRRPEGMRGGGVNEEVNR